MTLSREKDLLSAKINQFGMWELMGTDCRYTVLAVFDNFSVICRIKIIKLLLKNTSCSKCLPLIFSVF